MFEKNIKEDPLTALPPGVNPDLHKKELDDYRNAGDPRQPKISSETVLAETPTLFKRIKNKIKL